MRSPITLVVLAAALAVPLARAGEPIPTEPAVQERRVAHHLLRVQQRRFEARARGESDAHVKRLDREFKRTQGRWRTAREAVVASQP